MEMFMAFEAYPVERPSVRRWRGCRGTICPIWVLMWNWVRCWQWPLRGHCPNR